MSRHERLDFDALPVPAALREAPPVAEAPALGEAPPVAPVVVASVKGKGRKRAVLGLIALAVVGGASWEGEKYWTTGRFITETDDAYVQADIALLSSRVQGYVAEVEVTENQRVRAGEVLVRLDDGDARIALQVAEAKVATADRTLARIDAQVAAARSAVAQAQAGRDAASAQLTAAQANADRVGQLAESDVATRAQLDAATEGLATAMAGLAQAEAAIASAEAQVEVLKAQRAESEGTRHELTLAVDQARRNLDLTVLKAPADGVVANLALEVGDLVAPGARLAAVVPDAGLYVEANFKETQMAGLAPGAVATVSFDALPGQEFEGVVASAAPATGAVFSLLPADNATGNFTKVVQRVPVRVELPADPALAAALRAGLSATVAVDSRTIPTGAAAPEGVPVASN